MARNKSSRPGSMANDLSFSNILSQDTPSEATHVAQEVHEVQEAQEVHDARPQQTNAYAAPASRPSQVQQKVSEPPLELGQTQGRKGKRLKRMQMAFSDLNYEYMVRESRLRGMSATAFVNSLIEKERECGFSK